MLKLVDKLIILGAPIILDLCDNIFIAEYATDNEYVPG